ncbi:hypothetical protein D1872_295350 [compost metagenome]
MDKAQSLKIHGVLMRGLHVGSLHQFQTAAIVVRNKVGRKGSTGIHVFLVSTSVEIGKVKVFHFLQVLAPNGDMIYSH